MATHRVLERVQEILVDVLMLEDPARVRPEAHLVHDLGAESINLAEIAVALENEFGIMVEDDGLHQAGTVAEVVTFVERELARLGPTA